MKLSANTDSVGASCLISRALASALVLALAVLTEPSFAQPASANVAAPNDAYPSFVAIRINDQPATENALMLRAGAGGNRFYMGKEDAATFRFVFATTLATIQYEEKPYLSLQGIKGLSYKLDEITQTLLISATPDLFLGETVALSSGERRSLPTASLGSFLSYDLYAQRSETGSRYVSHGGQFEWGVFSPGGVLTNTFFANRTETTRQFTRLDTLFTIDMPNSLTSWRVGDTVAQTAGWGSPSLFAGVQYTTNFSTQPGYISYPLNSLSGQAGLPSVVDVYVNNVLTATQNVRQGPFTLSDLPNINGRGELRLIVRDLLGREQAIVQSLYGSTSLLKPGLDDFAFQAGTLRENYGISSNSYGRGFASGVWRRGINQALTLESALELARGQHAAGVGATFLAGNFGEFSASFAHSFQSVKTTQFAPVPLTIATGFTTSATAPASQSRSGRLELLRWDWRSSEISAGAQLRITSPGFRSIVSGGDVQRPRRELNTFASMGTNIGAFALGYTNVQRDGVDDTKLAQVSWSKGMGRWGQVSLNAFTALRGPSNRSITLGYFLPLDFTSSAGLSSTSSKSNGRRQASTSAYLQRNAPPGDGVGYRLQLTDRRDAIAGLTAQNSVGVYGLDVSRLGGITTSRVSASGSLVYLGEELVVGRRADSAFALVSVPGFADVRVMLNNQEVGRTNERGNLFVPRLRAYEANQISIEQQDLPIGAEILTLKLDATPFRRSGLVLRFSVRESFSAIANFFDEAGRPIPAGATLSINGGREVVPIAERGEAFLTGLNASNLIRVSFGGKSCNIEVAYRRTDDPQPFLGNFKCKLEK